MTSTHSLTAISFANALLLLLESKKIEAGRLKIFKMRFTIFFIACLSLLGSGCNKECQNIPGGYTFELPVAIRPINDTIKIGDTLQIESVFSELVFEQKTGKAFELRNWDFYPVTTMVQIDTSPGDRGALAAFDVIVDSTYDYQHFESSGGFFAYTGRYKYSDGQYELKFQMVPLESGLYCFAQGSWLYDFGADQSFEGKCRGIGAEAIVLQANQEQTNIEFLSESPDPHYNDWVLQRPQQEFHNNGGYCFYVVE